MSADNIFRLGMQAAVLGAVLPVWSNPGQHFTPSQTTILTGILRRCTEAVPSPIASGRPGRAGFAPDPQIVQQVVEMGFTEARVQEALRRVRCRLLSISQGLHIRASVSSMNFGMLWNA